MNLFALSVGLGPLEVVLLVAVAALMVWPAWRICDKAGFPVALGLLILMPVFNLLLFYWLAFADWPALRRPAGGPPEMT